MTRTTARALYKLMAYKDEYEVARLYTDSSFEAKLKEQFEGNVKLGFNLAPPLFAKKDKNTGLPLKREYGSWVLPVFKTLARLRALQGTAFDPFGYHRDRKQERQLITDYRGTIDLIVRHLNSDNFDWAVKLAALPEQIKGYGHVKNKAIETYGKEQAKLIKKLDVE